MLSEKKIKQIKRIYQLEKLSGEAGFECSRDLIDELAAFADVPGCLSTEEECRIKREDDIVVVGTIALAGTSMIAGHAQKELAGYFPSHFLKSAMALREGDIVDITEAAASEHCVIPIVEGGMYRALSRLWDICGYGFEIDYDSVPVSQETIEICEYYDIDPWSLLSSDAFIVVTDNAYKTVRDFTGAGIPAVAVGTMRCDKDKVIRHAQDRSLLNRPGEDGVITYIKSIAGGRTEV